MDWGNTPGEGNREMKKFKFTIQGNIYEVEILNIEDKSVLSQNLHTFIYILWSIVGALTVITIFCFG